MNPVPANRMLFWACYLGGTLIPIVGTFLISFGRRPHDDSAFLLSWMLWFFGAVLLFGSAWSVRAILLGGASKSSRPFWLYRSVGWLACRDALVGIHSRSRHLRFHLSGKRVLRRNAV